jgi:tetratricopeptide (TPR) repeat protein
MGSSKPGRNDPCPCGSGRKFKHCCAGKVAVPQGSSPFQLAESLLKAGRYEQAIAPLQQAARLAPSNAALLNDLGMACLFAKRIAEAIPWLRRALALRPDAPGTHYGLGLALEQSGDFEGAAGAYRRAGELAPGLADAHARLAEILLPRGKGKEALAAYDRAASAAPGTTLGCICEAKALVLRDRAADAEHRLDELVAREPACAEAHVLLGHVRNEAGRFDDAASSFERALALDPGASAAHFGLVSSKRIAEADRGVVARVLARLEGAADAAPQRMTLHFAAGKALDDLGDRAAAMAQFDAANRIRRRLAPFDRGEFARIVDRAIARYGRDFFAAHANLGDGDETAVLVVGMPRSGTTLVERVLSSHPRVAGGGELRYWNENAPAWIDAETDRLSAAAGELRAGYGHVLRGISPDADRVTDKMPFNFLWTGLVHALFPRARFVHCRRNPVDTCLSIYTTHFSSHWGFASDRGDLVFYYRQYLRLMEHWRSVLPPERFLEVDYEDVALAPEPAARKLVAFAGLAWDPACLRPERNPDAVKTASKWQARQPIYRSSVERWRRYEPWLGELAELSSPDRAAGADAATKSATAQHP